MSQLIFLGTAGSTAVINKFMRFSGGIIIQTQGLQLHLDPGPGAVNQARALGINVHHTSAILVSHNHLNHCNDLNILVEAMTHSGIEHRGIIMGSKSVLQETPENRPYLTRYHQSLVEKIIPLEKDHKIAIENIEIHSLSVEHTDPHAVGFKIITPRFVISYPGDTIMTEQLVQELMGTDILILNVPYPGKTAKGMNLDTDAAIKIVNAVKPKLSIMTHFGLEMIKADPLFEAREVQRITGVTTVAVKDGLTIVPEALGNKAPVKGFN